MYVRASVTGLGAALLMVVAPPLWAERSAQEDKEVATHFAESGAKSLAAGRWGEALVAFQQLQDMAPNPENLYNIALCHDKLGRPVEAIVHYRAYLKNVPPRRTKGQGSKRATIEKAVARLLPMVAMLSIETNISEVDVVVDGRPVGRTPLASVLVEAGRRQVEAMRNGYVPATETVHVAGGMNMPVRLVLKPVPPPGNEVDPVRVRVVTEVGSEGRKSGGGKAAGGGGKSEPVVGTLVPTSVGSTEAGGARPDLVTPAGQGTPVEGQKPAGRRWLWPVIGSAIGVVVAAIVTTGLLYRYNTTVQNWFLDCYQNPYCTATTYP